MAYGNRIKLPLFDDYWIDFRRGTIRRWFSPEYVSTAPWGPYGSMFYDPKRKKYRLYYEDLISKEKDSIRRLKLCESEDMLHFDSVLGCDGTDTIYKAGSGLHGCTVFYDKWDKNPLRRYKLCGMMDVKAKDYDKKDGGWIGVEIAFSSDGINWIRHPELVASPQTSDALNKLIYNPVTEEYDLFHRAAFIDRRISVRSSKDLVHWSDARIILQPGAQYNDGFTGMQHYSMTASYMDGIFYGMLWRYNTCLYNIDYSRMFGFIEPELVYSYDGKEYVYTTGKPLIERPYPPQAGCAGLAPIDMCESVDGTCYYIMCWGPVIVHDIMKKNKVFHEECEARGINGGNPIYRIRKDGFCGIESVGKGGLIITKGLELIEDDLAFNIRAGCGFVRFGIMNINGKFFQGFSLDDCVPLGFDDDTAHRPKWKKHNIKEVLGKQVRIVVELNTAILHCISATARPFMKQRQCSFACPDGIEE